MFRLPNTDTEESAVEIEQDESSVTNINIKLEYPYQSAQQLSFEFQEDNKIQQDNTTVGNNEGYGYNQLIEQDEYPTNIDIKLELPYRSTNLSFNVQQNDNDKNSNCTLVETTDPKECGNNVTEHISKKKLTTNPTCLKTAVFKKKKTRKIPSAHCTKCNIHFPSPFLFEQHMIQIHQDDRPYPCSHCGKPFASPSQQKMHETIHDPQRFQGEPQYSCDLCPKSYHLKRSLSTHKLKIHTKYKPPKRPSYLPVIEHHSTKGTKNPNANRKPKEKHTCPFCDLSFGMKCEVRRHLTVHTKERPYFCTICHQSFPRKLTLTKHIKTIHQTTTTPTGKIRTRPKSQTCEPCPCTICGKIYRVPSQLSRHMLLHTGERPHSCNLCPQKYRTPADLKRHIRQSHQKDKLVGNPLKRFKCRICGRDDFLLFHYLQQHRLKAHRNIPYDSEKEKAFACGICGKPYFLKEGALICAILGHDPSKLRKQMFKIKCPECPNDEEIFRFHNVLALRRHWDREHKDKQLPSKFRHGMYDDKQLKDQLPTCAVDRVKSEDIRLNGCPNMVEVESEGPLYVELDLLDIPEEDRFVKRKRKRKVDKNREYICGICGLKLSSSSVLSRHVKVMHDPNKKSRYKSVECKVCGKKFRMMGVLIKHEKKCNSSSFENRKIGRRPKKELTKMIENKTKRKTRSKPNCNAMGFRNLNSSVNIQDKRAVKVILNFQTVKVNLKRVTI